MGQEAQPEDLLLTEEASEPTADLSTLRWMAKDAIQEGVTFYGRFAPEGWVLHARRLAGVPVRFALDKSLSFGGFGALLAVLLEPGDSYSVGLDRRTVPVEGEFFVTGGEHPVLRAGDLTDSPIAFFRKLSREEFEIEVPWKTDFAGWPATRPIL